jgi:hypothetical protein
MVVPFFFDAGTMVDVAHNSKFAGRFPFRAVSKVS